MSEICDMLEHCVRGWDRNNPKHFKKMPHNFRINANGECVPDLPKGGHGEKDPEIPIGKIKHMVNALHIDHDCANSYLPLLRLKKPKN